MDRFKKLRIENSLLDVIEKYEILLNLNFLNIENYEL